MSRPKTATRPAFSFFRPAFEARTASNATMILCVCALADNMMYTRIYIIANSTFGVHNDGRHIIRSGGRRFERKDFRISPETLVVKDNRTKELYLRALIVASIRSKMDSKL